MKKALFTTSDFVRPANDPEKGGYILQVIPVLENGQHYDYTFLDYRSGEICRHHEDEIMMFDKPADFDNPQQRRRVKPLAIGDTVFDCEKHLFAVITDIDKFGFVHLDQNSTLELNQRHFDCDAELDGATWVVCDTDCLYQLVPGRVDRREGMPICYEHNTTMDNYPYYSPFLDENLFYIETQREDNTEDVPVEEKKETTENPDEDHIVIAPAGEEETIEVMLTEERFPKAFNNKLRELMDQKAFDSEDEARAWIRSTPFVLELYYEKDSGLFAVESEALESCPESICSPYTKTPFKDIED